MKKMIMVLATVLVGSNAMALDVLPKKVVCEIQKTFAEKDITEKTDISDLLEGSKEVTIGVLEDECVTYSSLTEGSCVVTKEIGKITIDYKYSAKYERGTLRIYDNVTGISTSTAWLKTDGKSVNYANSETVGGMRAIGSLNSQRGNLLGENRTFSIDVSCSPIF